MNEEDIAQLKREYGITLTQRRREPPETRWMAEWVVDGKTARVSRATA